MDKMSQFQFLNKCTIPLSSAVSAWKQEISSTVTTTRPLLRTAHALLALSRNVPGQSAPL